MQVQSAETKSFKRIFSKSMRKSAELELGKVFSFDLALQASRGSHNRKGKRTVLTEAGWTMTWSL
jgi:hypothetical protein